MKEASYVLVNAISGGGSDVILKMLENSFVICEILYNCLLFFEKDEQLIEFTLRSIQRVIDVEEDAMSDENFKVLPYFINLGLEGKLEQLVMINNSKIQELCDNIFIQLNDYNKVQ